MNENTFNVGRKVKIVDLNTIAEVASISDEGTQFAVKYNDAGGQVRNRPSVGYKGFPGHLRLRFFFLL